MFNNVTTTTTRGGGLIIDRNNNNDGVGSDVNGEPDEDDDQIQQVLYHGMGRTYNLFILLYSQWGYGSDKLE